MRYGSDTQEWKPWFDRINSDAWAVYKAKEGDEEEDAAVWVAAVAATVVLLLPLASVGMLVLTN